MNETNNIHGLLSERELDRALNTWRVEGASDDLAARIAADIDTMQQTESPRIVSPLLKTAAALLIAAGLGIFVGLMEDTPSTVDLTDFVFGQHVEEGLTL